jgi:hypothetical protein
VRALATSWCSRPSRWLLPSRSYIYFAASRSRIVHRVMGALQSRRLPLIYHQSYIRARALSPCGPTTPCLIPACGCADDAQLGMLCALPFWGSPRSWSSRGGRFFGFAPVLFARRGARAMEREHVALLLMRERERSEIRSRLGSTCSRYLPALVHLAHAPSHTW